MLIYRSFASERTAYIAQSDKVIMALRNMTLSQRKKKKKKKKTTISVFKDQDLHKFPVTKEINFRFAVKLSNSQRQLGMLD